MSNLRPSTCKTITVSPVEADLSLKLLGRWAFLPIWLWLSSMVPWPGDAGFRVFRSTLVAVMGYL